MAMKNWYLNKHETGEHTDIGKALTSSIAALENDQQRRSDNFRKWIGLYANRRYDSLEPGKLQAALWSARAASQESPERGPRVKLNKTKSAVDTLASQICNDRPKPRVVTDAGDWSLYTRARGLDQFVEAHFEEWGLYEEEGEKIFYDSAIGDIGVLKLFYNDDYERFEGERVWPLEIWCDESISMVTGPRAIYQVGYRSADVIKAMFPKFARQIDLASKQASSSEVFQVESDAQQVEVEGLIRVVEGWHLKSGKNAKDGAHVIMVEGCVLMAEEWEHEFFPFEFLFYNKYPVGVYGGGLVEDVQYMQIESDKMIKRISDAIHLNATNWGFYESGSLDIKKISNAPGHWHQLAKGAKPPTVMTPPSMSGQVFDWARYMGDQILEVPGISALSASSKKPAGIESGRALMTLLDAESQRFAIIGKRWRRFFTGAAKKLIKMASHQFKGQKQGDYSVFYDGGDFAKTIKWSDVNLENNMFRMKVYPVNMLPTQPAGRLERIEQLLRMQLMDHETAALQLESPDIRRFQSLRNVAIEGTDKAAAKIIDGGGWEKCQPTQWMQPLPACIKRMSAHMQRADINNAPEKILSEFRGWIIQAENIVKTQQAEAMKEKMAMQAAMQPQPPQQPQPAQQQAPQ